MQRISVRQSGLRQRQLPTDVHAVHLRNRRDFNGASDLWNSCSLLLRYSGGEGLGMRGSGLARSPQG